MIRTCNRILLSSLAAASISALASAAPIVINNHGFEADFAPSNLFSGVIPQGWAVYDPSGIIDQVSDAVGILNPTGGTNYPAGAPQGLNVALIYLSQDVGMGEAGLTKVLAEPLGANMRYTLTVEVGNIASGTNAPPFDIFYNLEGFPGYRVQLLAGGEVIAEDDNTLAPTIPEGQFRTSVIEVDIAADHPRLGQALEVRLINLNIPGTEEAPGIEVNFDNVRLDASPVPACLGDANDDGMVDFNDINSILLNWGSVYAPATGPGDSNGDGTVNFNDITSTIGHWQNSCR